MTTAKTSAIRNEGRSSPDLDLTTPEGKDYFPSFEPRSEGRQVAVERDARRAPSVIGQTLVFRGELVAGEDLLIEGRVEGSIRHDEQNLIIGPNGRVRADIHAQNVVIRGYVEGDIHASGSVVIEHTARVQGKLFAPRVALREGARFKGSIDMESEALEIGHGPAYSVPEHTTELAADDMDDLLTGSDSNMTL